MGDRPDLAPSLSTYRPPTLAAMSAHHHAKPPWAVLIGVLAFAAGGAAILRVSGPPRTAAEKLRIATEYQDVGDEPCYLCFSRVEPFNELGRPQLYARTPSQDPVWGYHKIYIC